MRLAAVHGIQHLPAQRFGAIASEVDVADIQQSARGMPRLESLLADVQRSMPPDFQRSPGTRPSRSRELLTTDAFDQRTASECVSDPAKPLGRRWQQPIYFASKVLYVVEFVRPWGPAAGLSICTSMRKATLQCRVRGA